MHIEVEKIQADSLRAQGYSDAQLAQMGFSTANSNTLES